MESRIAEVLERQPLQLLPISHPLLSLYAQNVDGRPAIVVDFQGAFDRHVVGTRGVKVHVEKTDENQVYVRFESVATGRTPMFEALVESLLASTFNVEDAVSGVNAMVNTFEEFKTMLASDRSQLGESSVRGLFAELIFIRDLREADYSPLAAMNSWHGPYRAAKDFVLPSNACVEVKSIRRQNHKLMISNLDQLDPRGEDFRLAVLELDRNVGGDGTSLESLVEDIQLWTATDPLAKEFFAQALSMVGLDLTDPYYKQWNFDVGAWRWFRVAEDFPRIRAASITSEISGVRYSLDIDQVNRFATGPFWVDTLEA